MTRAGREPLNAGNSGVQYITCARIFSYGDQNIGISDEAYARLKKFKLPGDSFSAVILRELPEPCFTAGEIEDYFREHGVPKADPKLRRMLPDGRGRRSHRK